MNISNSTRKVLINLDLHFDFYSTLFSVYRTYFNKQGIDLSSHKPIIEGKNITQGLQDLLKELNLTTSASEILSLIQTDLDNSLLCIKPVIGSVNLVRAFEEHNVQLECFTFFEDFVVKIIKTVHDDWMKTNVISLDSESKLIDLVKAQDSGLLLIDSSINRCLEIRKETSIPTVFLLNSKTLKETVEKSDQIKQNLTDAHIQIAESLSSIKWENYGVDFDFKWTNPSYYLQLKQKPANPELDCWYQVKNLPEPIVIKSKVVHGFGRGGKKLGIPTANFDMDAEIQEKVAGLVSGVYYGYGELIEPEEENLKDPEFTYGKKVPVVMSIGFNPYFNNKHKTIEPHFIEDFKKDFYGQVIRVEILGFIRTEADFLSFANLIEAIHNDVQVAKDILTKKD